MSQFKLRNAFRRWTDVAHALMGFAVGAVKAYAPFGWLAAFAFTVAFIVYQSVEAEPAEESYCNLVEFICGYMLATTLWL
jgi:hypothetical protein